MTDPAGMNVAGCPVTSAACATGAAPSSLDVRAAETAVAVATAAYLPIAEARGHISVTAAEHPSIVYALLACALIASVMLSVYLACVLSRRPPRRSSESATVNIGAQSHCTYTHWSDTPKFHLLPSGDIEP